MPVRIGELSRRVGVRPETLRAWERRYGLIAPARSDGGYRLYSPDDVARVRAMVTLLTRGAAASEAAKLAREGPILATRAGTDTTEAGRAARATDAELAEPLASARPGAGATPASGRDPVFTGAVEGLLEATSAFDDARANAVLDDVLARFSLDGALGGVVLPLLSVIGERWADGRLTVAQEHFCTELVRMRLLGIARGWGGGGGPLALLACPPGERHDLGLVCFALALRARGWRIAYLGVDTPIETLAATAGELEPGAIVLATVERRRISAVASELRPIAAAHRVLLAAAGAEAADEIGATALIGDPIAAADAVEARSPIS